ncbi:lipopolysaccharide kinase InaA family protein [Alienimonas californiensis]|uniref:3-deoxy-D-manno-octulosonic-acid kinase n=1 Tax=Alienimonas californiensis TaxID=2527989 RepID=A0A517PAT3_9PLAN|nr:lipopolysaccharide kinase InaA family protein [Alienimonas californiensis]QDT16474.1 3-deoxy-D-manno-octulosonic-acid kinase [Alienimonas californiensis]
MFAPSVADAPLRLVTQRGRGWAVAEFGADRLAALIAADDCPDPDAVLQKAGNTAVVLRSELALPAGPAAVCWKRIHRKTRFKRWATLVRTRRTVLTYVYAARLRAAGVETPRALACTAPHRWQIERPAWLLTDWVEGTEDLAMAERRLAELPAADRLRIAGRYAAAVGRLLGTLHAAGASHRDLKPNNVLITRLAAGDADVTVRAWVIDLDAVAFPVRLTRRRRRRDLARLRRGLPNVPRTALARFLRAYAAASPAGAADRWQEFAAPANG